MENQHLKAPLIGVLENIRSMFNVGSIFRSADGAGLERLLLCGFTAHPPRKEIAKTALGAENMVEWEYWAQATQAVQALKEQGYRVLALEHAPGSLPLGEFQLEGPTAYVVGHEVNGVSPEVLELCDGSAYIPMAGMKESLNVAVAFGVAAYALRAALPEELRPPAPLKVAQPYLSPEG